MILILNDGHRTSPNVGLAPSPPGDLIPSSSKGRTRVAHIKVPRSLVLVILHYYC